MEPKEWNQQLEANRREKRNSALTTKEIAGLDYSRAGTKIDLGRSHMDEGIPGQQKHRVELAYASLKEGLEEMRAWLLANGYAVS